MPSTLSAKSSAPPAPTVSAGQTHISAANGTSDADLNSLQNGHHPTAKTKSRIANPPVPVSMGAGARNMAKPKTRQKQAGCDANIPLTELRDAMEGSKLEKHLGREAQVEFDELTPEAVQEYIASLLSEDMIAQCNNDDPNTNTGERDGINNEIIGNGVGVGVADFSQPSKLLDSVSNFLKFVSQQQQQQQQDQPAATLITSSAAATATKTDLKNGTATDISTRDWSDNNTERNSSRLEEEPVREALATDRSSRATQSPPPINWPTGTGGTAPLIDLSIFNPSNVSFAAPQLFTSSASSSASIYGPSTSNSLSSKYVLPLDLSPDSILILPPKDNAPITARRLARPVSRLSRGKKSEEVSTEEGERREENREGGEKETVAIAQVPIVSASSFASSAAKGDLEDPLHTLTSKLNAFHIGAYHMRGDAFNEDEDEEDEEDEEDLGSMGVEDVDECDYNEYAEFAVLSDGEGFADGGGAKKKKRKAVCGGQTTTAAVTTLSVGAMSSSSLGGVNGFRHGVCRQSLHTKQRKERRGGCPTLTKPMPPPFHAASPVAKVTSDLANCEIASRPPQGEFEFECKHIVDEEFRKLAARATSKMLTTPSSSGPPSQPPPPPPPPPPTSPPALDSVTNGPSTSPHAMPTAKPSRTRNLPPTNSKNTNPALVSVPTTKRAGGRKKLPNKSHGKPSRAAVSSASSASGEQAEQQGRRRQTRLRGRGTDTGDGGGGRWVCWFCEYDLYWGDGHRRRMMRERNRHRRSSGRYHQNSRGHIEEPDEEEDDIVVEEEEEEEIYESDLREAYLDEGVTDGRRSYADDGSSCAHKCHHLDHHYSHGHHSVQSLHCGKTAGDGRREFAGGRRVKPANVSGQ
ncbi:uncharacterized protein VTP21DRAFT_2826 [Calcarisporiella thermophila]|uniref:uncharacterized protein n=1 Tax=Calcarisporiella thermophila TaxID=911321 RepID=UPI003743C457